MITPTYTPLATVTLASSASSVTFSNIPATYRDLVLITSCSFQNNGSIQITLNSDTGNNYSGIRSQGDGSATSSGTYSSNGQIAFQQINYSSNTRLTYVTNFMDYSATDKHKTVLTRNNGPANAVAMETHRWANNAAINRMLIQPGGGTNFLSGSTLSLYGIVA